MQSNLVSPVLNATAPYSTLKFYKAIGVNMEDNKTTTPNESEESFEKKDNSPIPNNDEIIVWAGNSEPVDYNVNKFVPHNPLERPTIHYVKPIIALVVYVLQFVGLALIPYGKWWITMLVLIGYSVIYGSFIAKRTIIWLVHLYQNKASDETRLRCTMEPSCSVYMILSVEKYGVIRGVYKGIRRLFRCGSESGIDYP